MDPLLHYYGKSDIASVLATFPALEYSVKIKFTIYLYLATITGIFITGHYKVKISQLDIFRMNPVMLNFFAGSISMLFC